MIDDRARYRRVLEEANKLSTLEHWACHGTPDSCEAIVAQAQKVCAAVRGLLVPCPVCDRVCDACGGLGGVEER